MCVCVCVCVCVCNPTGERLPFSCLLVSSYTICRTSLTLLPLVTPHRTHTHTPHHHLFFQVHVICQLQINHTWSIRWGAKMTNYSVGHYSISFSPKGPEGYHSAHYQPPPHSDCVMCQHKQYYLIYIGLIHVNTNNII